MFSQTVACRPLEIMFYSFVVVLLCYILQPFFLLFFRLLLRFGLSPLLPFLSHRQGIFTAAPCNLFFSIQVSFFYS